MSYPIPTRDRWLMAGLPAMVVLVVYVFGVYQPQQKALADTQRRLADARLHAVAPIQVAAKRQTMAGILNRLAAAKKQHTGASQPFFSGPGGSGRTEARSVAKITEIFRQQNVLIVSSERLSDNDARNLMPTELGESLHSTPGGTAGGAWGVWRVDTVGSFGDMQRSLNAVAALDALVVPLGISMEPSEDGQALHHWSIWFLM